MKSSCKKNDNFFLQMIRINYPDGPASCKEDGQVVEYFMQFLGDDYVVNRWFQLSHCWCSSREERKKKRKSRWTDEACKTFIPGETNANIFETYT